MGSGAKRMDATKPAAASTPRAKITAAAPRLGLPAEYGLSWTLPRLVGTTRAADLLLAGRVVTGDDTAVINGKLTLMGETRDVAIDARFVGAGEDPWGGYRAGFVGTTAIRMGDFPMKSDYGTVEFDLVIEGIRQ